MSEIKKNNEDIFLYEVHPKRVITGIPGIPAIRVRKSVYLTKDDVIKCLEKGSVYRRFSLKTERVTTANLDRVHREEYISEEKSVEKTLFIPLSCDIKSLKVRKVKIVNNGK